MDINNQFKDICRLCLSNKTKDIIKIFSLITETLKEKFEEVTNVELPLTSDYPINVCTECSDQLEEFYFYKKKLVRKQTELAQFLNISETSNLTREDVEVMTNDNYTEYEEEELEYLDDASFEAEVESDDICETEFEEEIDTFEPEEMEEYQVDPEVDDFQEIKAISADVEADSEEEFDIVYEDDITIEEEEITKTKLHTKRKYNKQALDTPKQYKCWIKFCSASFAFRATMKKHMNNVHSILCDKSTCFICGERYDVYADFLAHVKGHTRKSECDVCKLTFVDNEKMLKHKNRFHKKSDESDRNFMCNICQARFKRREHLNSHMVYRHSSKDARKFACKECSSAFLTRQDLKNHEKSHSQVKINCIFCSYDCRDLKSIRRHVLKLHNSQDIYKCICEETFVKFRELQAHKKKCSGVGLLEH